MKGAQTFIDALRRMALLLDPAHILRKNRVDNRHERIKLRAGRWTFPAVSRQN